MAVGTAVDAEALRDEVRKKYREVAANPDGTYHFHTGRPLAARLGYELAHVGSSGHVVGVDMTEEMLSKARRTATSIGFDHVEFREGLAEDLPIASRWADVVISNGVINLCADKRVVLREIHRVLRPGGHLKFADIANGRPVPEAAIQNIDLWTA
jgi:arsenite methyltransferase